MNRNRARRCLTGIDRLLVSQVWTGTPFWMVRSRLWRQANLTLPARIEVGSIEKTRCQKEVDRHADAAVRGQRLDGDWTAGGTGAVEVVAPQLRPWLRMGFRQAWFLGVQEIVSATVPHDGAWSLWINLNGGAVVWRHDDQPVAVLMGILAEPRPKEVEE